MSTDEKYEDRNPTKTLKRPSKPKPINYQTLKGTRSRILSELGLRKVSGKQKQKIEKIIMDYAIFVTREVLKYEKKRISLTRKIMLKLGYVHHSVTDDLITDCHNSYVRIKGMEREINYLRKDLPNASISTKIPFNSKEGNPMSGNVWIIKKNGDLEIKMQFKKDELKHVSLGSIWFKAFKIVKDSGCLQK